MANHLLLSAVIAADRGANERAVNVCKQSGLLQGGLTCKRKRVVRSSG